MNVLTIGNSFTWSLQRYFPDVVASAGEKLKIRYANFGGCELERHWSYIKAEIADPMCRVYDGGNLLREMLASCDWDVVTIQQASHMSWRPESFEPYAGNIINYVRQYAPKAEIMIQQTWAYRADSPRFLPEEWNITQQEMHDRLTENYRALSERHQLRVIPTGLAVALSRQETPVKYQGYDRAILDTMHWPDLPPQAGDVVGRMYWKKDPETGKMRLAGDHIHLNLRGDYMQACLWYAVLFNRKAADVTFVPEDIADDDAAFLREMAERARQEWK